MMAEFFGYNPPFIGGPENILSRQEDSQLIKNDLLQLLLTVPGDRVNRPTFGTPLRSFVFEQSTPGDLEILRSGILQAINQFEPRVSVLQLSIVEGPDSNGVRIFLIFTLKNDPKTKLTIDRFIQSSVDSR